MEEILRLEHLEKTFGTHQVLRDISFSVNKGDVISIIGSSIIVSYGFIRHDPVLILGQSFGLISYVRNLIIGHKAAKREKMKAGTQKD